MYPTKWSNQIGVLIRDTGAKLFNEIKEELKKGKRLFIMNSVIKIGDKFDCEAFGRVEVVDIYKSVTVDDQIYKVVSKDTQVPTVFVATADELDDYEIHNRHTR